MTKNQILKYSKILYAIEYKGRYCNACSLDGFENPWIMEYHHTDPTEKEYNVKNKTSTSEFSNIVKELDKCILLCSHCHKTLHSNLNNFKVHKNEIMAKLESIKLHNGRATSKIPFSLEDKNYIESQLNHKTISEIASDISRTYDSVKSYITSINKKAKRDKKSNSLPLSEILRLYNDKYSVRGIANKYNISPDTITKILLDNGLTIREKKIIDIEKLKQLVSMGMKDTDIAIALDCKHSSIWRIKKKLNI